MAQEKLYYRIGEVSRMVGVPPHVIRYWEKEFPQLRPRRMANHRLYRREDVELLRRIRELIHDRGFTVKGARAELRRRSRGDGGGAAPHQAAPARRGDHALLERIRRELKEIYSILGG